MSEADMHTSDESPVESGRDSFPTLSDLFWVASENIIEKLRDPATSLDAESTILQAANVNWTDEWLLPQSTKVHLDNAFWLTTMAHAVSSAAAEMRQSPESFGHLMPVEWFEGVALDIMQRQLECFERLVSTAGRKPGDKPN